MTQALKPSLSTISHAQTVLHDVETLLQDILRTNPTAELQHRIHKIAARSLLMDIDVVLRDLDQATLSAPMGGKITDADDQTYSDVALQK